MPGALDFGNVCDDDVNGPPNLMEEVPTDIINFQLTKKTVKM